MWPRLISSDEKVVPDDDLMGLLEQLDSCNEFLQPDFFKKNP